MGQGGYIFVEWDSVQKEFPDFQRAFAELEARVIEKCDVDWGPLKCGYLKPGPGEYGRTSILPALFRGFGQTAAVSPVAGVNCLIHWRQNITSTGSQLLLAGARPGNVIPEGFKVALIGFAFPNPTLNISEIRMQISDTKYVRVNLEELKGYSKPAVIFEEGYILNEEEAFELVGYVEQTGYQRIIPLGACYFRVIDKVLGAPGSAII